MKLSRLFGKPLLRHRGKKISASENKPQKIPEQGQAKITNTARILCGGNAEESAELIEWELRPGGMLVQRRDAFPCAEASSGPLIKVKVSLGLYQHDITIPSHASFGDLKWLLAQEVGLRPNEQRLIFQGKEKDDNEFLHIAGVNDMTKLILVEDPASKEKKLEEMKSNEALGRACQAVAKVRVQVDKLGRQISTLEDMVSSGSKVANSEFNVLAELLMRQLLELDTIHAEGEAKIQRRIEVRRLQSFTDLLDTLKVRHVNPICNNVAMHAAQWGTVEVGADNWAPPSSASTTKWGTL